MPQGGLITIETAVVELDEQAVAQHPGIKQGTHVMLKVTDTGTGMDAATRSRIFEPFFTTKEAGKGTGLGLATVFGIVTQSGGSIHVDSELGRGTTFIFHFPLARGQVETPRMESSAVAGGDETVLIVEDEQEVRTLLEKILRGRGYEVISAARPSDALRIADRRKEPIHLLLTDMVMPEMSGAVLSARLCAVHREIIVLQMSGYTDYQDEMPLANGRTAFLQKPFTADAVARAVREALDSARAFSTTSKTTGL
jgi:CheY-like chemotaxis protein